MGETGATIQTVEGVAQAACLLSPMRLRILEALGAPDSATGVARRLDLPRQKVNYHLRELERHGLVAFVEERRKGNCMERVVRAVAQSYLISPGVMGALAADPALVRDHFSSAYLLALAARAIRDLALLRRRADRAKKELPTLAMHTEVRFASAEKQAAFTEELANEMARLTAKYHDESAARGRLFQFLVAGYPVITRLEEEVHGKDGGDQDR